MDAEGALVVEARHRRDRRLNRRELIAKGAPAAAFIAAAAAFAGTASSSRSLDGTALVLIVVLALLSRLDFEVGPGSAVPTQLAFVPMLFALPLPLLPLCVCAGYLLGASVDAATGRLSLERCVGVVGCCWFSVPPALILWFAGEPGPGWRHWALFCTALAGQCCADLIHTLSHERFAHGIGLGELSAPLAYTYGFDLLFSSVALLGAGRGFSFLALLPIGGVLWLLARERSSRFDALVEATTDPLTGLANRRRFDVELAAAGHGALAVCLIDLDHFKAYNDRFGHLAGDELLRRAASQWGATVPDGTLLARIGGEEFALLIRGADESEAVTVVDRVLAATPSSVTSSAGLAHRRDGEENMSLLRRADEALYAAKQNGRARLVLAAAA
jgi:diguanylate cyclase (GGDEF)-like protein